MDMDRIHRDWMNKAIEVGENRKGACIVDEKYNILLGKGRAKMPCPGLKINIEDPRHPKYVCHAEVNAIVDAHSHRKEHNLNGCILYCTHHPCYNCGPIIVKSNIKEVHYRHNLNRGHFEHFARFDVQVFHHEN